MGDGLGAEPGGIAELIQAVQNADSKAAMVTAVRDLAAVRHSAAVSMLIEVLGYNNPGAAVAAVDGLVALGEAAVPALLEQLDGYNYGARAWAIRALSLIGDPRALPVLLDTAAGDFALSVRRAAVRGLGHLNWEIMPVEQAKLAQTQALTVLLQSTTDPEWVVRYAAVVGLEALALALGGADTALESAKVTTHLHQLLLQDEVLAVQARAQLAIETTGQI